MVDAFNPGILWDDYGIIADCIVSNITTELPLLM